MRIRKFRGQSAEQISEAFRVRALPCELISRRKAALLVKRAPMRKSRNYFRARAAYRGDLVQVCRV